ncbi:DoxX family protein [Neobacillus ginsengisoli]|uniref:Membrane protein YphA (DoxX/SURF4 family) n=1 Tax=Neobacillus ginsengisoli TaxID=904295 RepID=A0ABT9XUJ1_9BACI|nr:DoxX family protein [Neobacillus ginsengisoli]MDQ0198960.1 putative membrane protein YphA (DoxX/SURF4 family) [Neobacillus ginsengisoli]
MRKNQEIGSLLLRVVLGITFFVHGLSKFQGGIDNIGVWFHSLGIPSFMAYVVASIELVGGIAIILGLGTRIVSSFFVLILAGAILFVKLPAGLTGNGKMTGYELELSLMIIALYHVLNGSRFLSIDSIVSKTKGVERAVQN